MGPPVSSPVLELPAPSVGLSSRWEVQDGTRPVFTGPGLVAFCGAGREAVPPQSGFSYVLTLESFSGTAWKQGRCSGSLCQHESISLCAAAAGRSGGQGMR